MPIDIGIVGAGNRGQAHAGALSEFDTANVAAVADIDREAATELSEEHDVEDVYEDFRTMLDDAGLDAVSVCLHNNLHAPVAIAAAEAGCHIFCEKPIAATYADGRRMLDAANAAGVRLDVQNVRLFSDTTRAARQLVDDGALGEPLYGRGAYTRRRGRPYVDGYGTPAFVQSERSGGGAVIDIGVYVIGQLLYLVDNPDVRRVTGQVHDQVAAGYDESLVGPGAEYRDRVADSGYNVEDLGFGTAFLADGTAISIMTAWHVFGPDEPIYLAGTRGGVRLDEFEHYTTDNDYEATISYDLPEHARRRRLIDGEGAYSDDSYRRQFHHWLGNLTGEADRSIPTGEIALNTQLLMEGFYAASEAGKEVSADEITERSASTAADI